MIETTAKRSITLALFLVFAGCGGGGSESAPAPEPDPSPAPAPAPAPETAPAPEPAPGELQISISPHSGPTGTPVTVHASGFEAGARVGIGIGLPESEYDVISHATADASGEVVTTVELPDWTEPGRDYLFVARAPDGRDVISSRFMVTDGDAAGERVAVTGELTSEGVECPALRADDGALYTLAGDTGGFEVGDRVRVQGRVAEMSTCMQGTTLEVVEISAGG
jgi:hypothetical protein